MEAFEIILNTLYNTANWFLKSALFRVPWHLNYFWGLILISLLVWMLEIYFPWRKNQGVFRKDFFKDALHMFFNFFVFSTAISGFYALFGWGASSIGFDSKELALLDLRSLAPFWQYALFFIAMDFVQWTTHIILHKVPFLWRFHQIHHSVKEMGFAAHFRYHWMENILYKPLKTLVILFLGGLEPSHAYAIHFMTILIGHLNHANVRISWGPLKYLLNNPIMHLYHHAYDLPAGKVGVNFGISLSIWDYLFGTHYIPKVDGEIQLGFPGDQNVPESFVQQQAYGFSSLKTK